MRFTQGQEVKTSPGRALQLLARDLEKQLNEDDITRNAIAIERDAPGIRFQTGAKSSRCGPPSLVDQVSVSR